MIKPLILIVDDDEIIRSSVIHILGEKYDFIEADDFESGIRAYSGNDISLSILDIEFEKSKNGIDLLKEIKKADSQAHVIMLSSFTDIGRAITSMKNGASDYIPKTSESIEQELGFRIEQILERDMESRALRSSANFQCENNMLVFGSDKLKTIFEEIKSVGNIRILIEGETGTGKTPVAIYANSVLSEKGKRPFVSINCAGLTKERFQDQMFGHKKGAYTGSVNDIPGLVELAKGGDLFLDEIGDLAPDCQAELLTFLDNGEFRRLGDPVTRRSDCRIIAATNVNLKERVQEGRFRKDLYSRLQQCRIYIPPLRERKEDIRPVMEHYIRFYCGYPKPYREGIYDLYHGFDWEEGNVRELRDAVHYMCQKARNSDVIELEHVNSNYSPGYASEKSVNEAVSDGQIVLKDLGDRVRENGFENYMSLVEREVLLKLCADQKSSRSLAGSINISSATLHRKLRKHNIRILKI
ncbi:MAG: sigma-54-dependent Fis family transcriptional regulator [Oligoflexia bacterium]|nr:sigma-54-dependent Fis family transcriptional regulator [Oligoflexia bacterium]